MAYPCAELASDGKRECQAALEAGRAAMREQRYDDAYDHFSTVLELGQGNAVKFQV